MSEGFIFSPTKDTAIDEQMCELLDSGDGMSTESKREDVLQQNLMIIYFTDYIKHDHMYVIYIFSYCDYRTFNADKLWQIPDYMDD